jgi:hypothetical protein
MIEERTMPWFARAAWPADHRDEVVAAALVGSVVIILGYSIGIGSGTAYVRTIHAVRVVQEPGTAPGGGGAANPTTAPVGGGGFALGAGGAPGGIPGGVPGSGVVGVTAGASPSAVPTTGTTAPTTGPTGTGTSGTPTSGPTPTATPPATGTGLPVVGGVLNGVVCTLENTPVLSGVLQPVTSLLGAVTTPLVGSCATTTAPATPTTGATP